MSWFAVGGAAVSVVGGIMSDKKENKQRKEDRAASKEELALENQYAKEQSKFDAEQEYYYKQKERAGRQRGLDEFRKFNTLQDFAPTYQDTSKRIEVPAAPSVTDASTPAQPPAVTPTQGVLPVQPKAVK